MDDELVKLQLGSMAFPFGGNDSSYWLVNSDHDDTGSYSEIKKNACLEIRLQLRL